MFAPNGELRPGTIVDARYRIMGRIGAGGMATVYRAQHLAMQREVALKVLETPPAGNLSKRFEREARAVARLDHPGCVRVFDYGRSLGRQYIAMELVDGPTLADELDVVGRFPPALAIATAKQILDALSHAHERGVLHRDIKPSNVMLARRGAGLSVVLIDFGLARLDDEGPLTAAGICAGSPSYIAPERLAGGAYDARSDVYATGVLLYELLSGRRPFEGRDAKEIAKRSLREAPAPIAAVAPGTPEALAAIVMRAIRKNPSDRFLDAAAMRRAMHGVGVSPGVPRPARAAEETTLLEIEVRRPTLWRRLFGWLGRSPATRTLEMTSSVA